MSWLFINCQDFTVKAREENMLKVCSLYIAFRLYCTFIVYNCDICML